MIVPKIRIYTPGCIKHRLIDEAQAAEIEEFFKRLYHVRLNCRADTEFSLSDLMGGYNRNWKDTPLQSVYKAYLDITENERIAYERAARDAGWFLMRALNNDDKTFSSGYRLEKGKKVRTYKIVIR